NMTAATSTSDDQLISERVAGGILPKVLTTFDMVAIFVAIVLFITNAAVIQSAGPTAFGWWIVGFLVFLMPGAIVTGQLGRMFPGEGSIYLWTNKAFGSLWGLFAGFCACWPGAAAGLTLVGRRCVGLVSLGGRGGEVPLNVGVRMAGARSGRWCPGRGWRPGGAPRLPATLARRGVGPERARSGQATAGGS